MSGDSCAPNPCRNGGICTDGFLDFTCSCPRGWGGKSCDVDESGDSCSTNPCRNGGICTDGFFEFTCSCPLGWGGSTCEVDVSGDSCSPNPCRNGGACTDGFNTFTCSCQSGWGGSTCSVDNSGNSCSPNPCRNGGTCTDGFFTYTCRCRSGWAGRTCSVDVSGNSCSPNPCRNGGTCSDGFFTHTCYCRPQFSSSSNCINYYTGGLRLTVRLIRAFVEDRDGAFAGNSDPYVELYAFGQTRRSITRGGTNSPSWNQDITFSCAYSSFTPSFSFRVFDDDGFLTGGNDHLSGYRSVSFGHVTSFPWSSSSSLSPYSGRLYFEVRSLSRC